VSFIPVGVAAIIFYTFPLVILIVSPFVDGTRLTRARLIAFALAFAGIALAIGPRFHDLDGRGLILAALASAGATAQFFFAARAPGGGGLTTLFWVHAIILPAAVIASLIAGGPAAQASWSNAALPVAATIALYMLGFWLQLRGLRATSAATGSLIFCLEPIVATLSAAALIGERLGAGQYAGGVLVVVAIALGVGTPPPAAPLPA
jgi:drug/metabolite transporter (DMT)-like permease